MTDARERFRYKATVLGRYEPHMRGNEPHVTLNLLSGRGDHLVFCGTLTMSEPEWQTLRAKLEVALGEDFEVEDRTTTRPRT